jgi:hypothetical protein
MTKTFFDKSVQDELQQRLEKLTAETKSEWGKMNAAQMLTHCTTGFQVPLGDAVVKWSPFGLIGWMFKGMMRNDKPFQKNSPTAPEFIVADERSFEVEKQRFQEAFQKLAAGPSAVVCFRHAFFGKMTCEDWGMLTYKHVNHHFAQFGI